LIGVICDLCSVDCLFCLADIKNYLK